jgi:phosphomethylpyrimidine synthase
MKISQEIRDVAEAEKGMKENQKSLLSKGKEIYSRK